MQLSRSKKLNIYGYPKPFVLILQPTSSFCLRSLVPLFVMILWPSLCCCMAALTVLSALTQPMHTLPLPPLPPSLVCC
jgi:hypothetical protein